MQRQVDKNKEGTKTFVKLLAYIFCVMLILNAKRLGSKSEEKKNHCSNINSVFVFWQRQFFTLNSFYVVENIFSLNLVVHWRVCRRGEATMHISRSRNYQAFVR